MLEAQVKAKNTFEAKVQANAITRVIPDIFGHYQVAVPTDLGRLDYLGREILLNVEKGDWTAARNNASEVQRVWARLKPTLNATAQKSAADFESTVNALSSDVRNMDSATTTRDANALLDKVDVLETGVYRLTARESKSHVRTHVGDCTATSPGRNWPRGSPADYGRGHQTPSTRSSGRCS